MVPGVGMSVQCLSFGMLELDGVVELVAEPGPWDLETKRIVLRGATRWCGVREPEVGMGAGGGLDGVVEVDGGLGVGDLHMSARKPAWGTLSLSRASETWWFALADCAGMGEGVEVYIAGRVAFAYFAAGCFDVGCSRHLPHVTYV